MLHNLLDCKKHIAACPGLLVGSHGWQRDRYLIREVWIGSWIGYPRDGRSRLLEPVAGGIEPCRNTRREKHLKL